MLSVYFLIDLAYYAHTRILVTPVAIVARKFVDLRIMDKLLIMVGRDLPKKWL